MDLNPLSHTEQKVFAVVKEAGTSLGALGDRGHDLSGFLGFTGTILDGGRVLLARGQQGKEDEGKDKVGQAHFHGILVVFNSFLSYDVTAAGQQNYRSGLGGESGFCFGGDS